MSWFQRSMCRSRWEFGGQTERWIFAQGDRSVQIVILRVIIEGEGPDSSFHFMVPKLPCLFGFVIEIPWFIGSKGEFRQSTGGPRGIASGGTKSFGSEILHLQSIPIHDELAKDPDAFGRSNLRECAECPKSGVAEGASMVDLRGKRPGGVKVRSGSEEILAMIFPVAGDDAKGIRSLTGNRLVEVPKSDIINAVRDHRVSIQDQR